MKIELNHLARMEGHANLVVDAVDGAIKECRLDVVESPRFFEQILKGRHYSDVAPIAARICGVCSVSHTLASLAATEQALGVAVSDQTRGLRQLLSHGENMQSHLLHLFFMAAPDYLGVSSLTELARDRRELVSRALRLKKTANDLVRVVGGRAVHPVTTCVGGFSALPEVADLQEVRRSLVAALTDLEETVALFADFELPWMARETEYLCLRTGQDYPGLDGDLFSSEGVSCPVVRFKTMISEYHQPHSNAKFARATRENFMVGPLARYKNAGEHLSSMAKKVAEALGLNRTTVNPFEANYARLVEVVHYLESSVHLIDDLLLKGLKPESVWVPPVGGRGAAAIEAPRGLLFHSYAYDENGRIESADCVIPTAQNLGNIEADLHHLAPSLLRLPRTEMARHLEMLIRSYDPCISCSTHLMKIDFV